jgi:hypothetical protein
MRLIRILVASALVTVVPVLTAGAAQAELTGPCTGTGRINGVTYNPKVQDSVVIPRSGEVHWRGTVSGGPGKRPIAGSVAVKLPWPINKITLNGSWGKPSGKYANADIYTYDLPPVLVGPKFTVFGEHPALIASLLFTLLALLNVGVVLRVKGRAI